MSEESVIVIDDEPPTCNLCGRALNLRADGMCYQCGEGTPLPGQDDELVVLLQWSTPLLPDKDGQWRIAQRGHERFVQCLTIPEGRWVDAYGNNNALAVYDALEARHARVREAVQEWAKVHGGKYDCECMACHFLRRALEDSPIPPLPGTEP